LFLFEGFLRGNLHDWLTIALERLAEHSSSAGTPFPSLRWFSRQLMAASGEGDCVNPFWLCCAGLRLDASALK